MLLLVNNTDNTEGNSGRLIGVSHWLGNALCYWVLTEEGNIIARNILQHITRDEAENPEIQKSTSNYHIKLESDIGADYFLSYLCSMDELINKEVPSQQEEDFWRNQTKDYQTLLIWTMSWIKKIMQKNVETYDNFVGN